MELILRAERQGATDTGDNLRGALQTIGENGRHIKVSVRLSHLSGRSNWFFG